MVYLTVPLADYLTYCWHEQLEKYDDFDGRTQIFVTHHFRQWVRDVAHFFSHLFTAYMLTGLLRLKIEENLYKPGNIFATTLKILWRVSERFSSLPPSYTHMLTCILAYFGSKSSVHNLWKISERSMTCSLVYWLALTQTWSSLISGGIDLSAIQFDVHHLCTVSEKYVSFPILLTCLLTRSWAYFSYKL